MCYRVFGVCSVGWSHKPVNWAFALGTNKVASKKRAKIYKYIGKYITMNNISNKSDKFYMFVCNIYNIVKNIPIIGRFLGTYFSFIYKKSICFYGNVSIASSLTACSPRSSSLDLFLSLSSQVDRLMERFLRHGSSLGIVWWFSIGQKHTIALNWQYF